MLIDSHAHLDMKAFEKDRQRVLDRALAGGVARIVTVGIDLASSLKALDLANRHDFLFSTIGFHPHHADHVEADSLKQLAELAGEAKVVGWGEIGLDFYRNRSPRRQQLAAFEQQLDAAEDTALPVIIHDRDAHKEVIDILRKRNKAKARGVIHCFSGDWDLAVDFIALGFFLSIPGTVTYPQATRIREVASRIPLDRLLLETDSPFLTPVPMRGRRNEPLYVTYTAQRIAALREIEPEEVARQTSENASRLFGLPPVGP
ncbi:MAG: TatD family hydrolase [Deltaproteobacteria bacterium]|nr:TatD family hydrolase [Deltaproteobacteria bacterium]